MLYSPNIALVMNMLQLFSHFYPVFRTLGKFFSDCGLKKRRRRMLSNFFPSPILRTEPFLCVYSKLRKDSAKIIVFRYFCFIRKNSYKSFVLRVSAIIVNDFLFLLSYEPCIFFVAGELSA